KRSIILWGCAPKRRPGTHPPRYQFRTNFRGCQTENSPYMESITGQRSLRLSEEDQLEGQTTLSLETCTDLQDTDVLSFIQERFADFLVTLRFLSREDQELLLSYYILSKTQNTLALIHKSTQTVCSFRLRQAVKRIGTFLLLGAPTEEVMGKVFENAGLENTLPINLRGE